MTTTTRITYHSDDETPDRYLRLIPITADNETVCEECDDPILLGLAIEVSLDDDFSYPIVIHMHHLDPRDPNVLPYTAHLDI